MENNPPAVSQPPLRRPPSYLWVYAVAGILALLVLGVGIYQLGRNHQDWIMLAAGAVGLVLVLISAPIALAIHSGRACDRADVEQVIASINDRLDQMSILMNLMSDQQLLSERAKMIAYRDKDREALRRAISEEISRQEWDAASALVAEVERAFGRGEADRLRRDIDSRKSDQVRKHVGEAMVVIDRHTRGEQWSQALREAERLAGLYGDNEQVRSLPQEIEKRRQDHKRRLQESWNDAVARHDVDGSIEILKQLDPYLTPAEASTMQDTARTVFKEKLNTLGKQYGQAVQEHRWREAISIGDAIIRDFPNTRMAQEVREKMDALRARVAEGAASPTATL